MSFKIPNNKKYAESHEWVEQPDDGGPSRVGITDFAQDELGDIVFAELPSEGDALTQGEEMGVVESIKAVSDIYSPVTGVVAQINESVFDEPELINDVPYGDGWLLAIEVESGADNLLSPEEYKEQIQ